MAIKDDSNIAREISRQLDGLPLALDQAGAYIKETSCSLMDYKMFYQTRRREVLQSHGNFNEDYPSSVSTTWSLSFEKISHMNAAAPEFLNLCAFMAADAIPEEMITEGENYLTNSLQVVAKNPLQFDQMIKVLLNFSLIDRNMDETLNIHRLMQAVLQDQLDEAERRLWAERAMLIVNASFPRVEYETWSKCLRLLTHALVATRIIEEYQITSEQAGHLLHNTASYLQDRANYKEAEPLYQRALRIWEQRLGPEHSNVASSLNELSILYHHQGKYQEAEPLFQRAVHIWEQSSGPEHSDVAYPLTNLANLYRDQGEYQEAESLYQRALHIWEQSLRPEHPDVASPLNNLANLYQNQGRYEEAESLYQRALHIRELQFGLEHPDVASPLTNLANLYREQGKYQEAESLYQRALHIRELLLEREHPYIASSLNNLANLYREQGKYQEAESLYQRALHISELSLGPKHPSTGEIHYNFAQLREVQGNNKEARVYYTRALEIYEQAPGSNRSTTKKIRAHLITLLHVMKHYDEALQLETTQEEQK